MHSQNNEAEVVLNYFNGRVGVLLDIGANDGETFSNSRDLLLNGWYGYIIEPSKKCFIKLGQLYPFSNNIYNLAISDFNGISEFFESGAHVPNGKDIALVSCLDQKEKERWVNVEFEKTKCEVYTFERFLELTGFKEPQFNFITIDAEGEDWKILQQIDLTKIACECLCIEWNSRTDLMKLYKGYCSKYGMYEISRNAENIIFAR